MGRESKPVPYKNTYEEDNNVTVLLMSFNFWFLLLDTRILPNVPNCFLYGIPYSYVMRSVMLLFMYFFNLPDIYISEVLIFYRALLSKVRF